MVLTRSRPRWLACQSSGESGRPLSDAAVAEGLFHQPEREVVAISPGQVPHFLALPPVAPAEDIVLLEGVNRGCHDLLG